MASATARSTESWSVTSQAMISSPSLRSSPATCTPWRRSSAAVASPMPLAAPVSSTRFMTPTGSARG